VKLCDGCHKVIYDCDTHDIGGSPIDVCDDCFKYVVDPALAQIVMRIRENAGSKERLRRLLVEVG
jgi:ribosome-binding protein aMBF1 (putative translation factor)